MKTQSQKAFERFKSILKDQGIVLEEDIWLGSKVPHKAKCQYGHQCSPYPSHVIRRGTGCRACAGKDPVESEKKFNRGLRSFKAAALYPRWLGSSIPHEVLCSEGHTCFPRPSDVIRGKHPCRKCTGHSPEFSEEKFLSSVSALGGTPLYSTWLGAKVPHQLRCKKGHICYPIPNNVTRGRGICIKCKGKMWDVFYVVKNINTEIVKFGVTSGSPKARLSQHKRFGFEEVLYVKTEFPEAHDFENYIKILLKKEGKFPVQGVEYFSADVLATILGSLPSDGIVVYENSH